MYSEYQARYTRNIEYDVSYSDKLCEVLHTYVHGSAGPTQPPSPAAASCPRRRTPPTWVPLATECWRGKEPSRKPHPPHAAAVPWRGRWGWRGCLGGVGGWLLSGLEGGPGGGARCSGSAGPWCVFVNMHAFCHRAAQTRVSVSGSASVCHAAAIWLCMPTCVGASPSVTGTRSDLLVGTRHAPQRRAQQSLAFARLPVLTLAQSLALALRRPAVATHRPAESTEGADRPSHREPLRSTGRLR